MILSSKAIAALRTILALLQLSLKAAKQAFFSALIVRIHDQGKKLQNGPPVLEALLFFCRDSLCVWASCLCVGNAAVRVLFRRYQMATASSEGSRRTCFLFPRRRILIFKFHSRGSIVDKLLPRKCQWSSGRPEMSCSELVNGVGLMPRWGHSILTTNSMIHLRPHT